MAAPASKRPEQLYLYPHPLALARDHAEAEQVRLESGLSPGSMADSAAYSSMCATWGRLGGLTTFYRYGPAYYRLMARRRWEKVTAEDLAGYVVATKTQAGRS